jgi:hypothetical protein
MKLLKSIALISSFILSQNLHAEGPAESAMFSKSDIEGIEKKFNQISKEQKLADDKIFAITLLAARELYQYRHYKKSLIRLLSSLRLIKPLKKMMN